MIVPFKVAELEVSEVAEPVLTEGTKAFVVKVWSEPLVVPTLLVATSLKWYVIFSPSPLIPTFPDTALVPDPASVTVVVNP